jgi:hypothetical protein
MNRPNIILIDYENVQPPTLDTLFALDGIEIQVYLFTGKNQSKIPRELVQSIQKFGDKLKWVCMEGQGNNALDFHIAYFIGKLSKEIPNVFFHIISKDTGFDPLIETLQNREKILCKRENDIEEIPLLQVRKMTNITDKSNFIIQQLKTASHPQKQVKLEHAIKSWLQNSIDDNEIKKIIEILKQQKILSIENTGKVVYPKPKE